MQPERVVGLLLCDDLMFTSRVSGTGRDLGLTVKSARSADILEKLAQQEAPGCVIVDLANPGLSLVDLIGRLRASCGIMPRIVAFGSHVDAAGLQAARAAGCDVVLPRSAFVAELPRKLPEWLGKEANQ
jgi:CheY-like chemotaxis protein